VVILSKPLWFSRFLCKCFSSILCQLHRRDQETVSLPFRFFTPFPLRPSRRLRNSQGPGRRSERGAKPFSKPLFNHHGIEDGSVLHWHFAFASVISLRRKTLIRHSFDARISERDLKETHLPALKLVSKKVKPIPSCALITGLTGKPAAALGVKSGCDLSCDQEYGALPQAARESIVLLKNDNHTLPLNKNLKRAVEPGFFTIAVGGKQPGFKGTATR